MVKFVDTFSSVSTHPAIVGQLVADIVKHVNQYHHTKTCRKYKTVCRFKMPKLPSQRTIIAKPPRSDLSEKAALGQKHGQVVKQVREVLDNKDLMAEIQAQYPKDEEYTKSQTDEGRVTRINLVLEKAGLVS